MGQLAFHKRTRRGRAAGRRALNSARAARRLSRAFCASACLLALLASSLLTTTPLAQSGRKGASPPPPPTTAQPKGRQRRPPSATPTPTPWPAPSKIEGPIADPNALPPIPTAERKEETTETGTPAAVVQSGTPAQTPAPSATPAPSKASSAANASDAEEVDEEDVVRISSNLVPLPASVVDAQGRAVTDLQLKDFELIVDGEVKPIGEVSRADTPVSIALLYDNSASLRAGREFEKQAAIRFLRSVVRPIDRAAIYSIATEPELAHPLTNNVRALVRTVENFRAPDADATALFDTIAAASAYLRPQAGRKVIVVVSDGTDTMSQLHDFDTTMARITADDCQLYAVRTGHSESANLRDLAGERRLIEFAARTGGNVYAPRTQTDLNNAFTQIAAELAQQYVLAYYPAGERRDGRFRNLSVRVKTRPDLRVRTRKGYYAPKG
jgi:Ca-activated chloride channel family protein